MKVSLIIALLVLVGLIGLFLLSDSPSEAPVTNEGVPETSMEMEAAAGNEAMDTNAGVGADVEVESSIETNTSVEAASAQEFTIDSFNFGYSTEEIRVPAGTEVTINLTNSDGFHDWVVDEFNAATDKISAGDTTSVTFVADAPGTYEYYCSVGNHRAQGMVGTLVVE